MTRWRLFMSRVLGMFGIGRREAELDAEVLAHLDMLTDEYLRRGLAPAEARQAARREFGRIDPMKEAFRDQRGIRTLELFGQDLRHAARVLRRRPVFTALAILSLAIGIGGSTSAFGVIDPMVLRPLPVVAPQELVSISVERGDLRTFMPWLPEAFASLGKGNGGASISELALLSQRTRSFSDLVIHGGAHRALRLALDPGSVEGAEEVQVERASGPFFSVLGIVPATGRLFSRQDEAAGAPAVAVISHGLWRRRFGADERAIGRTITLIDPRRGSSSSTLTVIGVAPPDFSGLEAGTRSDIWTVMRSTPPASPDFRNPSWWQGPRSVARLRPGVSLNDAQVEIGTLYRRILDDWAVQYGTGWTEQQRDWFLSQRIALAGAGRGFTTLWSRFGVRLTILLLAVAAILLIACANIGALLLARNVDRRRELALRMALGSGAGRLARQLFLESAVLAVCGGLAGLTLAYWGTHLLVGLDADLRSAAPDVGVDARIVVFAMLATGMSGLAFGSLPALRAVRMDLNTLIKNEGDPPAEVGWRWSIGRTMLAAQVALAMTLLVGAGVFLRTLHNLRGVDTGYDQRELLVFSVAGQIDSAGVLDRLGAVPAIESATLWEYGLFRPGVSQIGPIAVDGFAAIPGQDLYSFSTRVGPRFFSTLGITLSAGRDFTPEDAQAGGRRVAIISGEMARFFFGDRNAVGRHFRPDPNPRAAPIEIVGVAEDVKYRALREEPARVIYLPLQTATSNSTFAIRTVSDDASLLPALRSIVAEVAPGARLGSVARLDDVVEGTLVQERLLAQVSTAFAIVALALLCLGLYGTVSYAVARRTREFCVRVALGARVADVIRLVMADTGRIVGIGAVLGMVAAAGLTSLMASLLFGVAPLDPVAFAVSLALLTLIAGGAALLPAWRASTIQPVEALRHD
jgi:predicted permease